jgi:hypothetical protein
MGRMPDRPSTGTTGYKMRPMAAWSGVMIALNASMPTIAALGHDFSKIRLHCEHSLVIGRRSLDNDERLATNDYLASTESTLS